MHNFYKYQNFSLQDVFILMWYFLPVLHIKRQMLSYLNNHWINKSAIIDVDRSTKRVFLP